MNIIFREVDPFNCWIWMKFSEIPTEAEKKYLDQLFDSWYTIGTLGDLTPRIYKLTKKVLI